MNLKAMFGRRYVVTMDTSLDAETPENRAEFRAKGEDIYYQEIKGRCGTVYNYSKTQVAIVLPTRAARRLAMLLGSALTLLQHADDAMCYKADASHVTSIVRFIKPKRLRQLTAERKAALAIRLARYRFQHSELTQTDRSSRTMSASVLPEAVS